MSASDVTTAGEQYAYIDQTKNSGEQPAEEPTEAKAPAKDDGKDKASTKK